MKAIYFAYGSNLLFARLHARTPSIGNLGKGYLLNHSLSFDKPGGDGSGKCGIEAVDSDEFVVGVLYEMDVSEKSVLDRIEGVGHGYTDRDVIVQSEGRDIEVFTYYPTRLDCALKPYDWYKEFVLQGAMENRFPQNYIDRIESVEYQIDPDPERRKMNLEILRSD